MDTQTFKEKNLFLDGAVVLNTFIFLLLEEPNGPFPAVIFLPYSLPLKTHRRGKNMFGVINFFVSQGKL